MNVTLLLDTDIVAYQFSAAAQKAYQWDEDTRSVDITKSDKQIMLETVAYIEAIQETIKADNVIVCLSDPKYNFRKDVLASYKGNRQGPKPEKLMWIKDELARRYESFLKPTLEADDVMGILSTHPRLLPGKKVIVSIDKDMKTIPGWLFNPDKDKEPWLVSEEEANWWHMYQTLTGDTTDGYKGCPKIGDKKAREILDSCRDSDQPYWPAVVDAYAAKGLTEEDALVQARCARILRHSDYNFKTKEPILWTPPSP